jgi:hypothetical protein
VTTAPHVLDTSALLALFGAQDVVYELWQLADRGELILIMPTTAIAEAQVMLNASHDAWAAVLWPDAVVAAPLMEQTAAALPARPQPLTYRHVVYEAKAAHAPVVTRHPHLYDPNEVAILPL